MKSCGLPGEYRTTTHRPRRRGWPLRYDPLLQVRPRPPPTTLRVDVSRGTGVAAKSVGLLLGLLVSCGVAPEASDTGAGEVSDGTVPTTVAIPATDAGSEVIDSAAPPATVGADHATNGPGGAETTGSVTTATRTVDARAGSGVSHEVADGAAPVEQSGEDTRRIAVPIGSAGIMVVNEPVATVPPRPPNDRLVLHPVTRIGGALAAKSVVASGTGLYFAQNMMYLHTISVLDHTKEIVKTIDDSVDLRGFGYDVSGDLYRGAPVEAALTSDGSFAFVSNYRMYGPGFDPDAGGDTCEKDQGQDSFVYRIDTARLEIDRVYPVGPVPKSLAVTPDDRLLLVSNWCGFDVTVIDLATHETVATVDVGRHPRGIAITGDGKTAYVAVMGSTGVAVLDLSAFRSAEDGPGTAGPPPPTYILDIGITPRHLVLSPDDLTLYVTLNREDAVVAVDLGSGQVIRRVRTGSAPRSMDISTDGTALYVVNYKSNTMSKIRTSDFAILQEFDTTPKPIGITYDPFNDEVWVSTYSGSIHVYAEGG